jgi:hypothetical protein
LWLAITEGEEEIANIISDAMEIRRRRGIALALALATHSRLGEVSPAAFLSQDLMAEVTRLAA